MLQECSTDTTNIFKFGWSRRRSSLFRTTMQQLNLDYKGIVLICDGLLWYLGNLIPRLSLLRRREPDTYTLLHKLACNIASYCTNGRGIFTSRRRVKMQPTSENNRDMHANECNKMFTIHTRVAPCLFPREVPSNSPFECIDSN